MTLELRLAPPFETDGLAPHYNSLSEDSRATGPAREGAVLFAVAEGRLDGDEDAEQALSSAEQALAQFKTAGDQRAIADAKRLVVASLRCKARGLRNACDEPGAKEALEAATQRAREEVKEAQTAGSRYGEAAMRLAEAECLLEVSGAGASEAQQAAEKAAEEARTIFKEVGVATMEGLACVTLAACHYGLQAAKAATKAAADALSILEAAEHVRGKARALRATAYAISVSSQSSHALEKGLQSVKSALDIYKSLGLQKAAAAEASFVARWLLMMNRPKDALPCASEAASAFKLLGYGRGWLVESRGLVVKALMGCHDWKSALYSAEQDAEEFRSSPDDKKFLPVPLERLAKCHMEAQLENRQVDTQDAHRVGEELLVVSQDLNSNRWQAIAYHNLAQISTRGKQWDAAEGALAEATKRCEESGDLYEKAFMLQTSCDIAIEQNEVKKALEMATAARKIFESLGRAREEATICQVMSECYLLTDMQIAADVTAEAQQMFNQLGCKKQEAACWQTMARIQRAAGALREAERSLRTAVALTAQSGDKAAQAYSLQAIAAEYGAQQRFDDALLAANEALTCARQSRDSKAEVEMLVLVSQAALGQTTRRAEIAASKGMDAVALWRASDQKMIRPAREAVCLARKIGDDYHTAGAIYAVAMVHLVSARFEAAKNCCKEAEERWNKIDNQGGAAYVKLMLAEIAFAQGKGREANDLVAEATSTFTQLGEPEGVAQAQVLLEKFKGGPMPMAMAPSPGMPALEAGDSVQQEEMVKGLDVEVARKMALDTAIQSIGDSDDIDMDSPLMDIGLDSLAAIAFRESLIQASGLQVPTSLVFDYPSLTSIADHLVETSMQSRK